MSKYFYAILKWLCFIGVGIVLYNILQPDNFEGSILWISSCVTFCLIIVLVLIINKYLKWYALVMACVAGYFLYCLGDKYTYWFANKEFVESMRVVDIRCKNEATKNRVRGGRYVTPAHTSFYLLNNINEEHSFDVPKNSCNAQPNFIKGFLGETVLVTGRENVLGKVYDPVIPRLSSGADAAR